MDRLTPKKRRWIVRRMLEAEWSVGRIAAAQDVSTRTCYNLWDAFRHGGWQAMDDRPRGRPGQRLDAEQRSIIVRWRKETGIGAQRMEALMHLGDPHWPRDWPVVPHNKINALFEEAGLIREGRKRGTRPTYIRFERDHSNSLWQTDWHWLKDEEKWLICYLDDHSRFVPAAAIYDSATTENALKLFDEGTARFGRPRQVLTDHGSQFTSTNPLGQTHGFETYLETLGVEHIMGKVKKPTTTGKIERFFFTYEDELARYPELSDRLWHYNFERPHQSLDYRVPAVAFGQGLAPDAPGRDAVLAFLSQELSSSWVTGGK